MIGVDTMASGCADGGTHAREEGGTPIGPKAAGDLAIGGGRAEFAFGPVVIGRDLGVVEKGKQVDTSGNPTFLTT